MKKKSEKSRLTYLEALVGIITMNLDPDLKEGCNQTGLSITTVRRYMNGEVSLHIHYNTLDLLASAAGLNIQIVEHELRKVHHG